MPSFYDKSDCCGAQAKAASSDEGTSHYVCTKCHEPCDLAPLKSNSPLQAQTDGVAWAISIIDELHIGTPGSDTTDRLMKGIKNDIRNRYQEATGIDPAPDYPVKVELRS